MKLLTQKKFDELLNVISLLYKGQKMMAEQINSLTNQVAVLNLKVLADAQPSPAPILHDDEADVDRVLGGGQDGGTDLPR